MILQHTAPGEKTNAQKNAGMAEKQEKSVMKLDKSSGNAWSGRPTFLGILVSAIAAVAFFTFFNAIAYASPSHEIALPNGEYIEINEDLKVKAIGGDIAAKRVWTNSRWYLNPEWTDLKFTFDPLDNDIKAIDRAGAIYERSGDAWFLETKYHIQKIATSGYRWSNSQGQWATYNTQGRITATGDRNITHTIIEYNAQGQRIRVIDGKGNLALTFTYNSDGLLETIQDRENRKIIYGYSNGRLTKVTDVMGYEWTYTYDSYGQIQSRTDPEGNTVKLFYVDNNPAGNWNGTGFNAFVQDRPIAIGIVSTGKTLRDVKTAKVGTYTDAEGNITTYQYQYSRQSQKYTVTKISPEGVKTINVYDKDGRMLQNTLGDLTTSTVTRESDKVEIITDARGHITRNIYDGHRNILRTIYPDGSNIQNTYNAYDQLASHVDELGIITQYDYDAKGNLVRLTEAQGQPEQRITEYEYDGYGQKTKETLKGDTEVDDIVAQWQYDDYGNIVEETNAENHTTKYSYNIAGDILTITDPRGTVTEYQYDRSGNLLKQTGAKGMPGGEYIAKATYDKVRNRTSMVDFGGNITQYIYDKSYRLKQIKDSIGNIALEIESNSDGRPIKKTEYGKTEIWGYDSQGRLIKIQDSAGDIIETVYGTANGDMVGLIIARQYPTYREEYRYNYQNLGIQTTKILSEQQKYTTQTEYDAGGRAIKRISALRTVSQYKYDALGQLIAETDAAGGITHYQYNRAGLLLSITDAKGSITRYEYNKLGEKIKEISPLGEIATYVYDSNGNQVEYQNPSGKKRVHTFNALNQLTKEEHFLPGQATPSRVIAYIYNANGGIVGYDDQINGQKISSAAYEYDSNNRKIKQTIDYRIFSKTHTFTYTAGGELKERVDPDNIKEQYIWSDKGQLQSITLNNAHTISVSNYLWGEPQTIVWPSSVTQTTGYDALMRIKNQQVKKGMEGILDRQYLYNEISNIMHINKEGKSSSYGYDQLGRLTGVTVSEGSVVPNENYTYDNVHNRLTDAQNQKYSYNQGHQLTGIDDKIAYVYNRDGHLIEETTATGKREYIYNASERLAEIKENGTIIVTYQYDPFGRRISKTANGQTVWYGYIDQGLVAEYDETGAQISAYGYWQGKGWQTNPIYKREGTSYHFYHNDHLGTPQRLTNQQGQISWAGEYEAFGTVKEIIAQIQNPHRFPGQYHDIETNLHQNYYRDYSPNLGRYLEKDPMGLQKGVNLFVYGYSNPLRYLDPLGLSSDDCCGKTKEGGTFWVGVSISGGMMIGPFGASTSVGRLFNTSTKENCTFFTYCVRVGLGLGVSGGLSANISFSGPYCGSGLQGKSGQVTGVLSLMGGGFKVKGTGLKIKGKGDKSGSISDDGGVSLGIVPNLGPEVSLTYDSCELFIIDCQGTPCECR